MNKKDSAVVVEITVSQEDYCLFEKFVAQQNLNQDEALRQVFVKGMRSFWSQQLADMVTEYHRLREQIEVYKKDKEILERIHLKNLELTDLLSKMNKAGEKV